MYHIGRDHLNNYMTMLWLGKCCVYQEKPGSRGYFILQCGGTECPW